MSDISFEAENVSRFKPQITSQRGQIAIHSENIEYREQLTKHSILPLIDRPKPLIEMAKVWTPLIPRVKLLGVFGILDPEEEDIRGQRYGARGAGGQYSVERLIPKPYPVQKFARGRGISAIVGGHPTPAIRQVSPQRDVTRQTQSARISVQI